jgi:hypothetical protein
MRNGPPTKMGASAYTRRPISHEVLPYNKSRVVGSRTAETRFGAYFVWWSLQVLDRLTPEYDLPPAVVDGAS